jgi:hypothetical protein
VKVRRRGIASSSAKAARRTVLSASSPISSSNKRSVIRARREESMKFHVDVRIDRATSATVEVKATAGKTDAIVSVRPKHSRVVYTGRLSDVAEIVVARHCKAMLAGAGITVPAARKGKR